MSCACRMDTVHPRLRGELVPSDPTAVILNGSSPLTRGTPKRNDLDGYPGRFIPAYAGSSLLRLCFHGGLHGSSPLTRGTPRMIRSFSSRSAVHPRLRGELLVKVLTLSVDPGSSPLTRGTPNLVELFLVFRRFIPAYAGNSYAR